MALDLCLNTDWIFFWISSPDLGPSLIQDPIDYLKYLKYFVYIKYV